MFWSEPEEPWARRAWWAIEQTRKMAIQDRREYRSTLVFSPDGNVRMVDTREGLTTRTSK